MTGKENQQPPEVQTFFDGEGNGFTVKLEDVDEFLGNVKKQKKVNPFEEVGAAEGPSGIDPSKPKKLHPPKQRK